MEFVFHAPFYNISCLQHTIFLVILSHQQDALTTIEGEALKNLALKKGSIQSRKLWDWMNEQADARPMYKQRSWQAVTNLRLKTASLVVRAL
ncbi:TPA: hypothetical protein ACGD5O_001798 [Escherichia coli]|nr:hypothetical protein [Escherichia coli]